MNETKPEYLDLPTASLVPYARNSRIHGPAQIEQIAASIREFGFTNPVLIDADNGIIAGHGRVMAAQSLGLEAVPCLRLGYLTDAQKRAYIIADNQLALNSGWDMDMLQAELADLQGIEFDLDLLGFDEKFVADMLKPDEPPGPPDDGRGDLVPEVPAVAVTKPGDIWLLGDHRVMCGDCTDTISLDRLRKGKKFDLCLTDPPYGLGNTSSDKNNYDIYNDSVENLKKTIDGFLPLALSIAPVVVLTPGTKNHRLYPDPNWTSAWFTPAGAGVGPWGFCCWQPILCYGKDPKLSKGKGSHPDAIVHSESAEKIGHPCTKPINFWRWLMERTSEKYEFIYDPFCGSGTTIIAAEITGRICYGMELSPQYCDVIVQRWQAYTGRAATLEAGGQAFDDLSDKP